MSDFINFEGFNKNLRAVSNKTSGLKLQQLNANIQAVLSRLGSIASTYAINYVTVRMMSDDPQTGTKDSTSAAGIQLARNCIDRAVSDVSGYMVEVDEYLDQLAGLLPSSWQIESEYVVHSKNVHVSDDGTAHLEPEQYPWRYYAKQSASTFAMIEVQGYVIIEAGDKSYGYIWTNPSANTVVNRVEMVNGVWVTTGKINHNVDVNLDDTVTFESYEYNGDIVNDVTSAEAVIAKCESRLVGSTLLLLFASTSYTPTYGDPELWVHAYAPDGTRQVLRSAYWKLSSYVKWALPSINMSQSTVHIVKKAPKEVLEHLVVPEGLRETIAELQKL